MFFGRWSRSKITREEGFALLVKIGHPGIAGPLAPREVPSRPGTLAPLFHFGIPYGRRVGDPDVQLEGPVALRTEIARPFADSLRRGNQGSQCAHAASVGDRGGQAWRGGTGHGSLKDWYP